MSLARDVSRIRCDVSLALMAASLSVGCDQLLGIDEFENRPATPLVTTSTTGAAAGGQGGSSGGSGGSAGGLGGALVGGGGSAPGDCWATPYDSWVATSFDRTTLKGENPVDPMLDPTGLQLLYMAGPAGARLPHVATRADRSATFSGGTELPIQWEQSFAAGDPWLVGRELFFTVDDGDFGPAVSVFDGTYWQDPVGMGGAFDTSASENGITVSADGTRMVFARADGVPALWGATTRLYEATRDAPIAPGAPFSPPQLVQLPLITSEHYILCPALSPDGTRLFFSTSYPDPVSDENYLYALKIWYVERATVDDAWQTPVHVTAFDSFGANTCMGAVTADGCELWLNRFLLGQAYNELAYARRAP